MLKSVILDVSSSVKIGIEGEKVALPLRLCVILFAERLNRNTIIVSHVGWRFRTDHVHMYGFYRGLLPTWPSSFICSTQRLRLQLEAANGFYAPD